MPSLAFFTEKLFQVVDGMKECDSTQWHERFVQHCDFLATRATGEAGARAGQDQLAASFLPPHALIIGRAKQHV